VESGSDGGDDPDPGAEPDDTTGQAHRVSPVLDTGALLAIDRRDRRVGALLR
jgi:hypothetical protein